MFETPDDQEEHIRMWLRDTANMKLASEELNIKWYTAWQEVLENSLYSMGDLIGLIPVSFSMMLRMLLLCLQRLTLRDDLVFGTDRKRSAIFASSKSRSISIGIVRRGRTGHPSSSMLLE